MKTNDMQFYILGYMKAMRVQTIERIRADLDIKPSEPNMGLALYNLQHEGKIETAGSLVVLKASEEAESLDPIPSLP